MFKTFSPGVRAGRNQITSEPFYYCTLLNEGLLRIAYLEYFCQKVVELAE
jgi:hypothetical protein